MNVALSFAGEEKKVERTLTAVHILTCGGMGIGEEHGNLLSFLKNKVRIESGSLASSWSLRIGCLGKRCLCA